MITGLNSMKNVIDSPTDIFAIFPFLLCFAVFLIIKGSASIERTSSSPVHKTPNLNNVY